MREHIATACNNCVACNNNAPASDNEPIERFTASKVMDVIGADLFKLRGKTYCALVEKYSGFVFMSKPLLRESTNAVVKYLSYVFNIIGNPKVLTTDNGPCYDSIEFTEWCRKRSIHHHTSSPHHHSGNGLAESGVKITKNILIRNDCNYEDAQEGIAIFNSTPQPFGPRNIMCSPSDKFYMRRMRTKLPALDRAHNMKDMDKTDKAKLAKDHSTQSHYDRRNRTRKEAPMFQPGDRVWFRNEGTGKFDRKGKIQAPVNKRSYSILTGNTCLRRNRNAVRIREEENLLTGQETAKVKSGCISRNGQGDRGKPDLDIEDSPRRSGRVKKRPDRYN